MRVRGDGPLAQVAHLDPWWTSKGRGEARLHADGRVVFKWPVDPATNQPMNPFAAMGVPEDGGVQWSIEMDGSVVRLHIMGQGGPQEIVSRHPTTW